MKNRILTLTATLGILASPLAAEDMKACDADTMTMVIAQVEAAAEGIKAEAMAELDIAKQQMEAGDAQACSTHLTNASTLATTE